MQCFVFYFERHAINYAIYNCNSKNKSQLLKLRYDTEMLITGKKSKKTLSEKYIEEKAKNSKSKKTKPVNSLFVQDSKAIKSALLCCKH